MLRARKLRFFSISLLFLLLASEALAACGGAVAPLTPMQASSQAPQTSSSTPRPPTLTPTVPPSTPTHPPSTPTAPAATADLTPGAAQATIGPQNVDNLQKANALQENGATTFAWLPGSASLAMATDSQVVVYQLNPPGQTETIPVDTPSKLTTSPDQKLLAWATPDNVVHLWSIPENREAQTFRGAAGAITSLAFSPFGDQLAASTFDNQVDIWDTSSGKLLASWSFSYWATNLSFDPNGNLLAGVDLQNFQVHIWNLKSGEEVSNLSWTEHASPVLTGAFFSPDWKTVAWVARGTVQLMDVATAQLGVSLSHEDFVSADIAWSPDGKLLTSASAATVDGNFSPVAIVWDVASGQPVKTLVQPQPVLSLAFSQDGKELGMLDAGGGLQLWAVAR